AQGKTDEKGKFRLPVKDTPAGPYYRLTVLAQAKGFGLGWAPMGWSGKRLGWAELRLGPEQVIKGRVRDLQGLPAAKVTFRVAGVMAGSSEGKGVVGGVAPGMQMDTALAMRRHAGFSFLNARPPRDLPLWPRPVATDAQGRFEIRGFG